MIHAAFLPITGVTAILNRLWRGEGSVPRPVWYAFMVLLADAVCSANTPFSWLPSLAGVSAWLLYFLGYALFPWQAMFSAITGAAPGRPDNWYIQWMQSITYFILGMKPGAPYSQNAWRLFGATYGTFRAMLMLPGIFALCHVYHSWVPLAGIGGVLMGVVYYLGYRFANHLAVPVSCGVAFSEVTMGWWHGTYILIVSSAL